MLPHMVTAQAHEFSSDLTVKITPRVLLRRMQICLSPCITRLLKSAPAGLASHEAEEKSVYFFHCIATGKTLPVVMVNPTNLVRDSLLSSCTALLKNPRQPCSAVNTGIRLN